MKKIQLMRRILLPTMAVVGVAAVTVPVITSCSKKTLKLAQSSFALAQLDDDAQTTVSKGWNNKWVFAYLTDGKEVKTVADYIGSAFLSKVIARVLLEETMLGSSVPSVNLSKGLITQPTPDKYTLVGKALTQAQWTDVEEHMSDPSYKITGTQVKIKIQLTA